MRITTQSIGRNYLNSLNNNRAEYAKLNQQIASGRKYTRISENVSDGMRALRVRRNITDLQQEKTLVRDAKGYISSAESALTSVNSTIDRVHELALKAKTDTMADQRDVIAREMENLQKEMLQMMNNQYAGMYLFAGTNNQEPPFSIQAGVTGQGGGYLYGQLDPSFAEALNITTTVTAGTPPVTTQNTTQYKWEKHGTDWSGGGAGALFDQHMFNNNAQVTYTKADGTTDTAKWSAANNRFENADGNGVDVGSTVKLNPAGPNYYKGTDGNFYATKVESGWGYWEQPAVNSHPTTDRLDFENIDGMNIDSITYEADGKTFQTHKGTDNNFYAVRTSNKEELVYNQTSYGPGVPVSAINYENGKYVMANNPGISADHLIPFDDVIYADIGMGIKLQNGQVDPRTGFQISFSGLQILGCGDDADGDAKNIYNLISDMVTMLNDPDSFNHDDFGRMTDKLETRRQNYFMNVTELGNRDQFLDATEDRIQNDYDNLLVTRSELEGSKDTDETVTMKMLEYTLNATLFMGNKLFGQSLMDYLR